MSIDREIFISLEMDLLDFVTVESVFVNCMYRGSFAMEFKDVSAVNEKHLERAFIENRILSLERRFAVRNRQDRSLRILLVYQLLPRTRTGRTK